MNIHKGSESGNEASRMVQSVFNRQEGNMQLPFKHTNSGIKKGRQDWDHKITCHDVYIVQLPNEEGNMHII